MRTWLVVSALLAVSLAGCFDDLPEVPEEEAAEPKEVQTGLRPGNNTLFLHADGDTWMDTEAHDGDTLAGTVSVAGGTTYEFPLRPDPERDVVHSSPLRVNLDITNGQSVGDFPYMELELLVDGSMVSTASGVGGSFELATPTWPAGAPVALNVCFCPGPGVVAYNYEMTTSGMSLVRLDLGGSGGSGSSTGSTSTSGDVTVTQQGDQWHATRTEVFNAAVGADIADIDLSTFNGDVEVRPGGPGSELTAVFKSYADSEDEARRLLSEMSVTHDARDGDAFTLQATANAPNTMNRSVEFTLTLPDVHLRRLFVDTSNDPITVDGFDGDDWVLQTSNDPVSVTDGTIDNLDIDTSNDPVTLDITVNDLNVVTSNDPIDAVLRAAASGRWTFVTSNDPVDLFVLEDAQRGYDITGTTSGSGDVVFRTRDTEPVGPQSDNTGHERTNDYEGRTIRTAVTVSTSNDDILVGST